MEGGSERVLGQPTSGSNWTAVTKFMLSAGMDASSAQELGLTCSLVLIFFFFICPYFFPKLFPVCVNSKDPWHFSNLYWGVSSINMKMLSRWGNRGSYTYMLACYLYLLFLPSLFWGKQVGEGHADASYWAELNWQKIGAILPNYCSILLSASPT